MNKNRRNFTHKPPKLVPCEQCTGLIKTPTFLESLMVVRKFKTAQDGTDWYHMNGHTVFVE